MAAISGYLTYQSSCIALKRSNPRKGGQNKMISNDF